MQLASVLVALALTRVGEVYVLGAQVPKDNPDWHGPWDCAEYASWLAFQVTGKLIGCQNTGKPPARADAYSGAWDRDAKSIPGIRVTPEVAMVTPGAVLVRAPSAPGTSGHVAISLGNGKTVEAYSASKGVIVSTSAGRRWDHGVLIPGVKYEIGTPPTKPVPVASVIVFGSKNVAAVRKIQELLNTHGTTPPLTVDGGFGKLTAAAVVDFQTAAGLVPDAEVGPATMAALEAPPKAAPKTAKKVASSAPSTVTP